MRIKLEKGMYQEAKSRGISFSQFLEEQDPSPPGSELDAFERQLKRFGIVVSGEQVSLVDEFYRTYESRVLFPEFINRAVLLGFQLGRLECKIEDLVAIETPIDAATYTPTYADDSDEPELLIRVGEFGEFPTTTISLAKHDVRLIKFGRCLKASYETLRRMKVDLLKLHLAILGLKLRRIMVRWGLEVIINGDGNSNPAPVDETATSGLDNLAYGDLVDFTLNFESYESTHWCGVKEVVAKILKMTEFKDVVAGFNFQATGELVSPMGNVLRLFKYAPGDPDYQLLGWDKNAALQYVYEAGASLVEVNKVINQQFEETVISKVAGFAKIFTDASRILDIVHT